MVHLAHASRFEWEIPFNVWSLSRKEDEVSPVLLYLKLQAADRIYDSIIISNGFFAKFS